MKKIAGETTARMIGSVANGLFWIAKKLYRRDQQARIYFGSIEGKEIEMTGPIKKDQGEKSNE